MPALKEFTHPDVYFMLHSQVLSLSVLLTMLQQHWFCGSQIFYLYPWLGLYFQRTLRSTDLLVVNVIRQYFSLHTYLPRHNTLQYFKILFYTLLQPEIISRTLGAFSICLSSSKLKSQFVIFFLLNSQQTSWFQIHSWC